MSTETAETTCHHRKKGHGRRGRHACRSLAGDNYRLREPPYDSQQALAGLQRLDVIRQVINA